MSSTNAEHRDPLVHLPVGTFPAVADVPTGHAATLRIRELEALCAEVYEAAVLLGLPPALLAKLWTVGARGNRPQGFAVELPPLESEASLPDIPLTHRPATPAIPCPQLPPLSQRKTVMVVDDDPAMLELIIKILETENYELLWADHGATALERFEQHSGDLDLLITDLMMPGVTGTELAASMRTRVPTLRVLYQTGFTDSLFKAKQELEAGAAFVEKPFSARALLEAARMALYGTLDPAALAAAREPQPRSWSWRGRRAG